MNTCAQPGRSDDSDPSAASNLSAAIDRLWIRFLPEIRERVGVLDAAAATCAASQLTDQQREAAHAAAHKLAGTLGTFNLARGTELARELELVFARNDNPGPAIAGRLAAIANELRALIDSRM
jgi:HPt (histidine-containing phosphotransfer) domain-containing protein